MRPFEVDRQTELIRRQVVDEVFFDFCECCEHQYKCPQDMYFIPDPYHGCDKFEVRRFDTSAREE